VGIDHALSIAYLSAATPGNWGAQSVDLAPAQGASDGGLAFLWVAARLGIEAAIHCCHAVVASWRRFCYAAVVDEHEHREMSRAMSYSDR
jgi:hypothetical protein